MEILHAKQALTANGWANDVTVEIAEGRIASVEPGSHSRGREVDLLLPAPTNLHSHAFQRAMSGLTETRGPDPRDTFWTWRRLMYRFLDQLSPEDVEAIASLVFMEMLEAGYAAVAEFHYLHHDVGGKVYNDPAEMAGRIVTATQATGIGLTLLPVLYSHGGCDRRSLEGGQKRFGNNLEGFERLHEASATHLRKANADAVLGVAPHSLRAVDPETLKKVGRLGDGPVHIHAAEQMAEVDEVKMHLGGRPVEWLLNNLDIDRSWCLIHCTQMSDAETTALAKTGAVAGLCPITEANLGDGIFNCTQFLAAGGRFGVGSDSNVHIALFEELCMLDYSQRLRDNTRAATAEQGRSAGRVLFEGAARGAAQAAGRNSGQIAPGAWADLIALDRENEWIYNRRGDLALDALIFGGRGRECIRDVWSAGRHVVQDGCHKDRENIVRRFRAVMDGLRQGI
ncbi:formimidoylglutamate deiminase [Pseudovibrio exalbescens]|uniref:Formimidoylglutamate deiminase n=1 Tax=Pseudovibrio exalbescens TaxID=197461 RepID=A0A1U7JF76_9HYPH|nr:formimidoylglutamate deiminase [Pseudovibrio exalbescens]OKL43367.1 formimidoylglutamate deiminase [Pseudovibrio exalbescens]